MSGGKRGFVVSTRPRQYRETPAQRRIKAAAEYCGIKKGIPRTELVEKMKTCIPEYHRKVREGLITSPSSVQKEAEDAGK